MSFNQKSDVKKHLSARRHQTVLPFRSKAQTDIAGNSEDKPHDEKGDTPNLPQKSGSELYTATTAAQSEVPTGSGSLADARIDKKPQV